MWVYRYLNSYILISFIFGNRYETWRDLMKCEALAITNKPKPISFTYFINGQSLSWNEPVKYLGLLVDHKLNWSKHCKHTMKKATRSLNYLRFSMYGCSRTAKCAAYTAIVRPSLEYSAVVCSPHSKGGRIAALNLASLFSKLGNSFSLFLFFMTLSPLYIHQLRSSL